MFVLDTCIDSRGTIESSVTGVSLLLPGGGELIHSKPVECLTLSGNLCDKEVTWLVLAYEDALVGECAAVNARVSVFVNCWDYGFSKML